MTCTACKIQGRLDVEATYEAKLTEEKWIPVCDIHAEYLNGTTMRFGWSAIKKDSIAIRKLCGN